MANKSLAELHAEWAALKEEHAALLRHWLPTEPVPDCYRGLPEEVRQQFDQMEERLEEARVNYVNAVLGQAPIG